MFLLDTTLADSISRNWPVRIAHLLKEAWKDDPDNIRHRFKRKFRLSPTRTEQKISWQDADDLLGIFPRHRSAELFRPNGGSTCPRRSNQGFKRPLARAPGLDAEPDYGCVVFKQMGQMFGLAKGVFCSSFSC